MKPLERKRTGLSDPGKLTIGRLLERVDSSPTLALSSSVFYFVSPTVNQLIWFPKALIHSRKLTGQKEGKWGFQFVADNSQARLNNNNNKQKQNMQFVWDWHLKFGESGKGVHSL